MVIILNVFYNGYDISKTSSFPVFSIAGLDFTLNIDSISGILAVIIVASGVIALFGTRVIDTGLSEFSIKIIYTTTLAYGIWLFFSSLCLSYFNLLPINSGWIIYLALTLFYSFGIFGQVTK